MARDGRKKEGNERRRRLVPPKDLCGFPIEETLKQDAAHDEDPLRITLYFTDDVDLVYDFLKKTTEFCGRNS